MEKTTFKNQQKRRYPEATEELLELSWQLFDYGKAKECVGPLARCVDNHDIAWDVIRRLYVHGAIDDRKAVSERFIESLLPFTSMDRKPLAHSVAYHVRNMLADRDTRAARRRHLAEERDRTGMEKYAIQVRLNITTNDKEIVNAFAKLTRSLRAEFSRIPAVATWTSSHPTNVPTTY